MIPVPHHTAALDRALGGHYVRWARYCCRPGFAESTERMLPGVHARIMRAALTDIVSPRALQAMINANVGVDAVWNQFGRHELHFDENAFDKADEFMSEQRDLIQPALEAGKTKAAWHAFGRLTHTAQDFYSHTNYVDLWLSVQADGSVPTPEEIEPLDTEVINSAALHSGKAYLPLGMLSFLPLVGSWISRLMPEDSHAGMNLDSGARGPRFAYAFHAAVKRTQMEYHGVERRLPQPLLVVFRDLERPVL